MGVVAGVAVAVAVGVAVALMDGVAVAVAAGGAVAAGVAVAEGVAVGVGLGAGEGGGAVATKTFASSRFIQPQFADQTKPRSWPVARMTRGFPLASKLTQPMFAP